MARPIHPTKQKAIAQQEAERLKHPIVGAAVGDGDAEALESEALRQHAEEVRLHVPGLVLSDIPCTFLVQCAPRGTHTLTLRYWREPERWKEALATLADPGIYMDGTVPQVPKGWSYPKLVGDRKPERFDMPNPRVYTLDGRQLLGAYRPGALGRLLRATFEHMLLEFYRLAPDNLKRAEVLAFLEYHRTKGGNPVALADHVERMLEQWKATPPKYVDIHKLARIEVPGIGQLTTLVEGWLANAPKAPTSAKANAESKGQTFAALFGEHLPEVLRAMEDAGIQAVTGKGIGKVVGALHAACDHFGKRLPPAQLWPAMVEQLFPHVKCSAKVKPILNARERGLRTAYAGAYWAIMDRLK